MKLIGFKLVIMDGWRRGCDGFYDLGLGCFYEIVDVREGKGWGVGKMLVSIYRVWGVYVIFSGDIGCVVKFVSLKLRRDFCF